MILPVEVTDKFTLLAIVTAELKLVPLVVDNVVKFKDAGPESTIRCVSGVDAPTDPPKFEVPAVCKVSDF